MYQTNPTPRQRGNLAVRVLCIILAVALGGSLIYFGFEISNLKNELAEYRASASNDGGTDTVAELEGRIEELSTEIDVAASRIEHLSYTDGGSEGADLISVAAEVKESVVLIRVTTPSQKVSSGFFYYFTDEAVEEGTGIILTEDGYIATNEHVISSAKAKNSEAYITVTLSDGTTYPATLVGSDKTNDLAVIKIDSTGLSPIAIGSSSSLMVGQTVLAVGNPLGSEFAGSVTMGIVSALERKVVQENTSQLMIQHDAAINPGNSGGALVNAKGELIGINTVKISSTAVEGLGFAIPTDYAMPILEQLIEYGYVRGRVTVGLSGQTLSDRHASYYGMPAGLMVTEVTPDSGADIAGINVYDVITEFDGQKVSSMNDIERVKSTHAVGDIVKVTYFSYSSGEYVTANLMLMEDKSN